MNGVKLLVLIKKAVFLDGRLIVVGYVASHSLNALILVYNLVMKGLVLHAARLYLFRVRAAKKVCLPSNVELIKKNHTFVILFVTPYSLVDSINVDASVVYCIPKKICLTILWFMFVKKMFDSTKIPIF